MSRAVNGLKNCAKCKIIKSVDQFSRQSSNGDGLCCVCRSCQSERSKIYKSKISKERIANTRKIALLKYKSEWVPFFESLYGVNPACQVCGKILKYTDDIRANVVDFDHRHIGCEPIQNSPSHFWKYKSCNDKNKYLWMRSDFGILCSFCNTRIPTHNRNQWIIQVNTYDSRCYDFPKVSNLDITNYLKLISVEKNIPNKWKKYFISRYCENPKCQMCFKDLKWPKVNFDERNNVVCFDHRLGEDSKIDIAPSIFMRKSPTFKIIKLWEENDFGHLCLKCNYSIPSNNRRIWLDKVNLYIFGTYIADPINGIKFQTGWLPNV